MVCDDMIKDLDNIYVLFDNAVYRQIVGFPWCQLCPLNDKLIPVMNKLSKDLCKFCLIDKVKIKLPFF